MAEPFGEYDNDYTADKAKNRIKNRNFLPPEVGMFVRKDKTQYNGYGDGAI